MEHVIITRHPALRAYLVEAHGAPADARVLEHAHELDVRDRVVWGVLPLHLAVLASEVRVVTLDVPPERRGDELSVDDLRAYDRGLRVYRILRADTPRALLDHVTEALGDLVPLL